MRSAAIAGSLLCLAALAAPASAGDWRHHHHRVVAHTPWYDQDPWIGTGPGYYYSHHPDHIPAYPIQLTGYPVPIYDKVRPVMHVARRVSTHIEWCAARYRSYDVRTDTWQPYDGPRRRCR